jgi:hypothetical protein
LEFLKLLRAYNEGTPAANRGTKLKVKDSIFSRAIYDRIPHFTSIPFIKFPHCITTFFNADPALQDGIRGRYKIAPAGVASSCRAV